MNFIRKSTSNLSIIFLFLISFFPEKINKPLMSTVFVIWTAISCIIFLKNKVINKRFEIQGFMRNKKALKLLEIDLKTEKAGLLINQFM